ncbi:protein of unknown function [uncultured Woeseiaceae bacterium]|uniref:Uncharacterized protein n=1 Tax=uncultured Woeseiaceae bacterium TaxID=1983305 RepID=A0A7D9D2H4_9GAMM|nr:protein of unknown function [uncultured Woeseiaceae bacterium]
MADVFLSYKREDRPLVRPLVRALQMRGFTVWWDSRIETGENWLACIKRALDAASCVVVVWTPQSVGADGIYASQIIEAEAEEGRKRDALLPVRMQSGPLPFLHDRKQAENLGDWQENADDPAFVRLTGAISTHCGEREPPEPAELDAWLAAEGARNADAYREFVRVFPASRFSAEAEPRAAEIEHRVADLRRSQEAALRIVGQFAEEVSKPSFTPPLGFTIAEREEAKSCTQEQLFDLLAQGAKAVLHAGPGGGKTVKLLDWAQAYSDAAKERIGVFIRLKEVANMGDELIAHLSRLEPNISERAWSALARSGLLTLFCDGWNELNDIERESIGTKLDIYARTHPAAGLVVGSRPLAPPPLKAKHALLVLERLSYAQIRSIVEAALGGSAQAALAELQESRDMVDLVRTPFFLFAFCETRRAGTAPTTREGLIRGMIIAGEQLPQHDGPLRQLLGGQQTKYLRALAVEMLNRQQAELSSDGARRTVNRESAALIEVDLVRTPPDASVVLDTLRDHHYLVEHAGTDRSYRFQHQLISEWYASDKVRGMAARALTDGDARRAMDRDILNDPAWTEAIVFAAESAHGDDEFTATSYLILRAIGIAPGLAADLIAVAPEEVWQRISSVVISFVEEWSQNAKHQALQFVVRCGKSEFADLVWEAITAEESGSVGQALRSTSLPYPAILGPSWREKCASLSAEHRRSLLAMLASSGSLEGAAMAVKAAVVDDDPKVPATVAEMLDFRGYRDELAELLRAAKEPTWEEIVSRREIEGLWDDPWGQQAIAAAHRVFARLDPGPQRIHFGLRLRSLGEDVDVDFVSELLELKVDDHHTAHSLLAKVAEFEEDRLSRALLEKVLNGERVTYWASRYIKRGTPVSQECLLELSRTKSRYRENEILSPLLDRKSLATLLLEFVAAHEAWRSATGNERNAIGEKYGALEDALMHADRNTLADVLLSWEPVSASQIGPVGDLMMRAYRRDRRDDEGEPLRPELRSRIVERLRVWAELLITESKQDRHGLHSLAEAIATFPSTALLTPLRSLLMADLEQWRKEREEFEASIERGAPPDPASGARLSNAYRYGQNMLSLATGRDADIADDGQSSDSPAPSPEMTNAVIDVLSEFLTDRLFGTEAARVIATLRLDPITQVGQPRRMSDDIRVVPDLREYRQQHGVETTDAIALRLIAAIDELRSDGSPDALHQAARLANSVTRMSCGEHLAALTALVAEHGNLELISTHVMIRLLFGHEVDGSLAEACLDQLDARREEKKWEYNESWFKWEQLLVLMVFGGKPVEAARRLLTYDRRSRDHDERRIAEALGLCGHPDALEALDLVRDRCVEQRIIDQWCSAVRQIGSVESAEKLLAMLLEMPEQRDWYRTRSLSKMVAELAESYPRIREEIIANVRDGNPEQLSRIAEIVRHMKDENLLTELLAVPEDRLARLGGAIEAALRDLSVQHRPVEGSEGLSEIVPRPISKFRAVAFARASADSAGSEACMRLLMFVDVLRDEYGESFEESRHPDISIGKPWPPAARCAWEASEGLAQ